MATVWQRKHIIVGILHVNIPFDSCICTVHGAYYLIDCYLTIVLTGGLQHPRKLEETVCDGVKFSIAYNSLECRIRNTNDRGWSQHAAVDKTSLVCFTFEILNIQGACNALAP